MLLAYNRKARSAAAGAACTALVLLSGGSATTASAQVAGSPGWCSESHLSTRLNTAISTTMRETRAPGVMVGVWSPNCGYEKASGVANKVTRAPMRTDFYVRIGSVTKTYTVTALLQLVDAGKVRLDDPIGKYVKGVPAGSRITLRELAGMRSGLFNYSTDEKFDHRALIDPYRTWTPRQLLRFSFSHRLVFPPGKGFQYSNTNTILLGLVIEKVSGLPLPTFIERHILRPLGLRDTLFPTDNSFPRPHPQGYTEQTLDGSIANATRWNPSWGWAAGAMISTLQDSRTWAKALATGTLLKPGTQAQRFDTVTPPGANPRVGYGLGLFTAEGWIGHNGSLPGYQSLTVYLPQEKTTLVVFVNSDISPAQGGTLSTAFGTAITRIITPGHVFRL